MLRTSLNKRFGELMNSTNLAEEHYSGRVNQRKALDIKVAVCTIAQLFTRKSIQASDSSRIAGGLNIPEYQRPYRWQSKQIEKLIADVKEHRREHPKQPYYLGSLILHQEGHILNIIDGQQRLTTLALMGFLCDQFPDVPLRYNSTLSQSQIKQNLEWLHHPSIYETWSNLIDLNLIQVTLVITQSEDDAYLFFETQNTGGVRLKGPDIIKAHHLRAIKRIGQPHFARQWEALGDLDEVTLTLLRGRYWQKMNFHDVPVKQQVKQTRDEIVYEFAEKTLKSDHDVAFGRLSTFYHPLTRSIQQHSQYSYALRQPLNAGVNTVSYLTYFQQLKCKYWDELDLHHQPEYVDFCEWLKELDGCKFLEELYVCSLMFYISQYGEESLSIFAKKLFRVVYSKRVSNQLAVRADSVSSFIKNNPVLDWIAYSYTPLQICTQLDAFELTVNENNLEANDNSVKKQFIADVNHYFKLGLKSNQYKTKFAQVFSKRVQDMAVTV